MTEIVRFPAQETEPEVFRTPAETDVDSWIQVVAEVSKLDGQPGTDGTDGTDGRPRKRRETRVTTCPVCLDEHPPGERTCEDWAAYWRSLTPEQRRDEELMMARYASDD